MISAAVNRTRHVAVLAAFAGVLGGGHASAATHTFSWLVDSDNNVATGCTLDTAHGQLAGVDQVFVATVTTSAADAGVTRLERRICANGVLGTPTSYDTSAWPVGLGLGTGGSAVIETYAPLSMLPQRGTLKVVVTSRNATDGEDATVPFLITLDAPQALADVVSVPVSRWLVLPLALLLFATAQRWNRRRPGQRFLGMFVALCVVAGVACAATVLLDGNPADWGSTSAAVTDAAGNAPPNADIVAVYQQRDATRLFVRIDADIRVEDTAEPGPKFAAIPDQVISLGQRLRLRISANDPDAYDTLTYGLVSAPPGAAFDPTPVLDWTPAATQLGPHPFTVSAVDSAGHGDVRSFTVTVVAADQPPMFAAQPDTTLALGSTFSRILTATDPDAGDVLTFALVSAPAGMTLNGATLNWPTQGATLGSHPVIVSVTDVAGAMDVRQFQIIVSASAPPIANADSYSVHLGDTLTLAAPGVLANDIDPFGRLLTASKLDDPGKGLLTAFNADGSFTYVAPPTLPVAAFQPVVKTNVEFNANFSSHFVVADLDGDGKAEIVVRYLNAGIAAFHEDGTLMWSRASFAAPYSDCYAFLGSSGWSVAAGDLADDGKLEIVMPVSCNRDEAPPFANVNTGAGPESRYIALNGVDGSVKWLSPPLSALDIPSGPNYAQYPLAARSSPTIARLRAGESPSVLFEVSDRGAATVGIDGDGNPVTGSACSHLVQNVPDGDPAFYNHYRYCRGIVVLNGVDGSVRQRMIAPGTYPGAYDGDTGYEQSGNVAPIVADLDGDGVQEIVAGSAVFNVDGSIKWQLPEQSTSDTALGNFDDTPDIEVVRFESAPDPALAAYKSDGRVLWRLPLDPKTVVSKLTVGDIDGSGRPSILVNFWSTLCAFDYKGNYRWCYDATRGGVPKISSRSRHAIYDLDGDGAPEVIVSAMEQLLFLDGATGKLKYAFDVATIPGLSFPPSTQNNSYETPAPVVSDTDGDGHAKVIFTWIGNDFPAPSRLTLLKAQDNDWQPARQIMNQAAYFGANVNDNGSIPTPPLVNNFAAPASNVFGTQPRLGPSVDPRKREQTSFRYAAHGGGLDSLPATVTVDLLPLNRPPVFTSSPPRRYLTHTPFSLVAQATDPDVGDTVTYALVTYTYNGGNCAIVATTGVLTCNEIQTDDALFLISATDNQGATTLQTILMQSAAGSANVPGVVGQSQAAASTVLESAGFSTGDITEVYSGAPSGEVISQEPGAGSTQLLGEAVALSISKGRQPAPTPNVTGSALGSAATVLGASGFHIGTTTYAYSSAGRGEILSQSPAPGVSQVPGPIDVSVSGGTGLEIQLTRSVTTADAPIDFSVVARAPDGALQPTPPIDLAITPAIETFAVNAPVVVGGQVVPNANSLGAYTLTATDPATHRSASAGFAVSHAAPAGTTSNAGEFARFSHVLLGLGTIRDQLQTAHDGNDITAMRTRLQDMVDLWHTLNLTTLIGSAPVAPQGGFPPQIDDMAAFGVAQTPDDLLYKAVLTDAAADLKTLQDAWTDPSTSLAELNALNATFQTRAKRLQGLVPGEYGLVDGIPALTAILSARGPRELDAMFKDIETLLANPAKSMFASKRVAQKSDLGEQLTVLAVETILAKLQTPYIQFMTDSARYAGWTSAIMVIRGHLKSALDAGDIDAIVSGASLSIHIFEQPYSMIEGNDLETRYPDLDEVWILGPDIPSSVLDLISGIKNTFNYFHSVDPNAKLKDLDAAKAKVDEFKKKLQQGVVNPTQAVVDAIQAAFQPPSDAGQPCVFSADPACKELFYPDGFKRVYTYSGSLQLPVPILFLVYNPVNGKVLLDTPAFLPCRKDQPCGAP